MTINVSSSVHTKPLSAIFRGLHTRYADAVLSDLRTTGVNGQGFPQPHGCNTREFMASYLAYNLLRKSRISYFGGALPTEEQLVEKAVSSFLEVEVQCKHVNLLGRLFSHLPTSTTLAPETVIQTARRKIAKVLGEFSLDEFSECIDFSNGASTRLAKRDAAVPVKFTGEPHVTRSCALLAVSLIWYHEPWRFYCQERFGRESDPCQWVTIVEGSEYFTVPKTSHSLRGAAKEPELNMLCQKAIGSMIRRRLKRVRIDLDDQTYNQYLAGCGSRTGSLATIDLEAASDSVSLRLVKDLLPHDWYRFITMTRSEKVLLPNGCWHTLEKVSSMGNGFTFELESLMFWALTAAVVDLSGVEDRRIGVYGDDIICHHTCAPDLINVLMYCGFKTNVEKTWIEGPFRESCGKHWFLGYDVTPFLIKEDLDEEGNRFHTINSLNEWCFRFAGLTNEDVEGHDYAVRKLLPKEWSFIPPHCDSKGGIYPPSCRHVPGLVFSLKSSGYLYKQRLDGYLRRNSSGKRVWRPGRESKELRATPAYLAWHLKAQAKGCGGEPSQIAITTKRVVYRWKHRSTSMWADLNVRLPKSLLML